jgi:cytochrome c oxidase cbb3-type subunit III
MSNDHNDERLLDHEYDGIQEYDNPMPRWWVYIFWATIIYSVIYLVLPGDMGAGAKKDAMYEKEMAAWRAAHPAPEGGGAADVAALTALLADPAALAAGEATYVKYCQACHAPGGAGMIGPNLADDAFLHGGSIDSVYLVVSTGVLAKGMPAWQSMLKPDELDAVVAYVKSLQGTTPANPKAPEGIKAGT